MRNSNVSNLILNSAERRLICIPELKLLPTPERRLICTPKPGRIYIKLRPLRRREKRLICIPQPPKYRLIRVENTPELDELDGVKKTNPKTPRFANRSSSCKDIPTINEFGILLAKICVKFAAYAALGFLLYRVYIIYRRKKTEPWRKILTWIEVCHLFLALVMTLPLLTK